MLTTPNIKSNLHTHTTFCDGKDAPEEIVRQAIAEGMDTIGFSGHSFTPIDTSYCMSEKNTDCYVREIERLCEIYGDRINILCGIEMDLYGKRPKHVFDYVIGSVHYVRLRGEYSVVDLDIDEQRRAIQTLCSGNPYQYVRAYFDNVAKLPDTLPQCDVIGHLDLLTKFNEGGVLFDETDPRFLLPAYEVIDYLIERDMMIEINTGAISRGYRRTPYPSVNLLRHIVRRGGKVTLSSDAHSKEHLMGEFSKALGYLRVAGIQTVYAMTRGGWTPFYLG